MKLPAASCGVSCEILRSRYPHSPRLWRVLLAFIPAAAYSAEAAASAAKAGSYGVFGEGESSSGKRLPLSLGRKNDRNKEQHCCEQHNGGTGGNIPVGGDEDSSH